MSILLLGISSSGQDWGVTSRMTEIRRASRAYIGLTSDEVREGLENEDMDISGLRFIRWVNNTPPAKAKRFAHASTKKARASQIPLTQLNEWGHPAAPWVSVGFFKSIWESNGVQAAIGFTYWIDEGE